MASFSPVNQVPSAVPQLQQGGPHPHPPHPAHPAPSIHSSPISETTINVAFINCVGQSKFPVSKQLEIQSYVKSHNIDILHLQECKIDSESFSNCNFLRSNYNVFSNNTPNDTNYGTASLVRCDLDVTNVLTDDKGRVIVFDAAGCTWGNFYLPSGTDGPSKALREKYSAEILPQLLLQRQNHGAAGGDLNAIISCQDSNRNAQTKISPSFKTLVSSFSFIDSFRILHPKSIQFSRYYCNDRHGEGASRIDRCYHWGNLKVLEAEYHSISFSDHLSHRLKYALPLHLDRYIAPNSKPQFRIPPEIASDPEFQSRLRDSMLIWNQVREAGADLLTWWQYLVKRGIRHLAKERGRELLKQRRGQLNLLLLRQAYLTKKLSSGDLSSLTALEEVKLRVTKWYDEESKKIILTSRVQDLYFNEKVRIYHHDLHRKFKQKSSILRLQAETGEVVEGHAACAAAVEGSVASHLLRPAVLDPVAQEILLREVQPCFTEADILMLEAPPLKEEVKLVLSTCNSHAAPGTDGLTAFFYKQNWDIIGDALTEVVVKVFKGSKPTSCQRTSLMVFGNKPGKKAKSLLISDRRKLSLLNVDFKLMTGIEAARIRKSMTRTISPNQLVTGGDRRISHGVAMARDAILAASSLKTGCGILDTDLVAAFDNMVLTWCFQVMKRKGLSEAVIGRYRNLYDNNFSVVVVNNIPGRCVKNARLTIRQGDKFSMELFTFGIDPVLGYLEKRLQGIPIHHLPVEGPVLLPLPPPAPLPDSPPPLHGQPALPPPPSPERHQGQTVLPPLVTRYVLTAYCDDLKPAITSIYEFKLVERVMTIFEMASGCKMHRTRESEKCKFLALSSWRRTLCQDDIPFDFFTLSDHLDFLGVTLKATTLATRKVNGDILQERIRNTVGPWKGGRFMALNLRPHSVNCFALSKLQYRFNVIDPRVEDLKTFVSISKSFMYADLLEKPEERILYRSVKDGGLGFYHIQSRAIAALTCTFLQTAINPKFRRNHFHNALFRRFVLGESVSTPPIPPHFRGDFFPKLREMHESLGDLKILTFREIYRFFSQQIIFETGGDAGTVVRSLLPLKCELASPATEWERSWRLARQRGLGPELTSFLLKMLWGILPCKARIARILPKVSPDCQLCNTAPGVVKSHETLEHAFFTCAGNHGVTTKLLNLLRIYDQSAEYRQVLTLDLNLDDSLELPLVWIVASFLFLLWQQRQDGKVCPVRIRAELEARCRLLREGKGDFMHNCSVLAEIAIRSMYSTA